MAIFGLGTKTAPVVEKEVKKENKAAKPAASGQSDEAKAILAKMAAKKDAGDCPFC
jgi:hypothetical protein